MGQKRYISKGEGHGSEFPCPESKKRFESSPLVGDCMDLIPSNFLESMVPMLRQVVREEVERGLQICCCAASRSPPNQIEPTQARTLQLQFLAKIPATLFTCSRVESEDSSPITVVLFDSNSKKIVESGPLSSIKLEIVALNGEFSADDREDWTQKDFESMVVNEREGKRPLVTGDLVVTMKGGVGNLGEICFTDNSSWLRCRKFRLGVKVQNSVAGVRIREAVSEAFMIKDQRGELYKKHYPPSLSDEIWRLEKIAKDGAFHKRLASRNIFTVKQFLQWYITDPLSLRNALGGGVSNKTFEIIIKHATACVLDDKLYKYLCDEGRVALVLNSVFKVVYVTFDGQNYRCLDSLSALEMQIVENLKSQAYKNLDCLVPIEETSVFGPPLVLPSPETASHFTSGSLGPQNGCVADPQQDQLQAQTASYSTKSSPSQIYQLEDSSQHGDSITFDPTSMQVFSPALRNSFVTRDFYYDPYNEGYASLPNGPGTEDAVGEVHGKSVFWQGENQPFEVLSSKFDRKLKAGWCKIRAAVKWVSIRRDVAAKRRARLPLFFDL